MIYQLSMQVDTESVPERKGPPIDSEVLCALLMELCHKVERAGGFPFYPKVEAR